MNQTSGRDLMFGSLVVCGAVLYRPLTFWAENAWDLSSPQSLIPIVVVLLVLALGLHLVAALLLKQTFIAAFVVGALTLALFNWTSVRSPIGFALLGAATLSAVYAAIRLSQDTIRFVALGSFAIVAVLPTIQLVYAHFEDREPYPLGPAEILEQLQPPLTDVEDVLILIVDGYPMSAVAEGWFGHDTTRLASGLDKAGFETPEVSWSHNTFTSLSLASMLQLTQVARVGVGADWANLKPTYDIARGDNNLVRLLGDAGYEYVHIESGWNGDTCSSSGDCLKSSWLDEANWQLLSTSLFRTFLESRWASPNVINTRTAAHHIDDIDIFGDGNKHLVFAHFMLPHSPFVVDSKCELLDDIGDERDREDPNRIAPQLRCVDELLLSVIARVGDQTVVIIAGDHGTATRAQLSKSPSIWDDADIAERLGAFLAYRIPETCPGPEEPTNVSVARAMVTCITGAQSADPQPGFVMGLSDLTSIDRPQLRRIETQVLSGTLIRRP